ncbi:hypothetical protein ABBQ32_010585 [Trebouxia sp. C0010 RCD-2024]
MEARAGRTNKQQDRSLRSGARPVQQLQKNAQNISGSVLNIEHIAADLVGKQGFDSHLAELTRKKEDLQKRVNLNKQWTEMFDKDVAPFQQKYVHLVEDIHNVYGTAKEFHAKGIQMLIDEFNYHVAYKRWDDTFNAIPFKPK